MKFEFKAREDFEAEHTIKYVSIQNRTATPKSGFRFDRHNYQDAFLTPGISPFEAISRNWMRLIPNRRM